METGNSQVTRATTNTLVSFSRDHPSKFLFYSIFLSNQTIDFIYYYYYTFFKIDEKNRC